MDDLPAAGEPQLEANEVPLLRPEPPRPGRRAAEPTDVYSDPRLWAEFSDAADTPAFVRAWLNLQCRMIAGTEAGAVFAEGTAQAEGAAFAPVAVWPAGPIAIEPLKLAAEAAAKAQAAHIVPPTATTGPILAVPLARDGRVRIIVVVRIANNGTRELRGTARRLQWGAGWLATRMADGAAREAAGFVRRAEATLDILALANEHVRYEAAAMAVANELQTSLGLANVSVGLVKGRRNPTVRLVAVSRATWFRRKSALLAALENAMGEALDQSTTIAIPEGPDMARRIAVAHRAYAQAAGMVGSSRVDLQACKLEYSIVSPK